MATTGYALLDENTQLLPAQLPPPITILDGNKVGVGTTTPEGILHVSSSSGTSTGIMFVDRYSDTNLPATIYHRKARGSESVPANAGADDFLGEFASFGWEDTTGSFLVATNIVSQAESVGINRVSGRLLFSTTDLAGAYGERMRISADGNVGIGTTSPSSLLHVNGSQTVKRTAVGTGAYTILTTDYYLGKTSITGGGDTITLPSAVTVGAGKIYIIKDESGAAGTNNITIDGDGTETIDGTTTRVINTNYGSMNIISDGTNWYIY